MQVGAASAKGQFAGGAQQILRRPGAIRRDAAKHIKRDAEENPLRRQIRVEDRGVPPSVVDGMDWIGFLITCDSSMTLKVDQ